MDIISMDQIVENFESISSFSKIQENYDFIVGYHGTTHRLLDSIKEKGLIPREESDMHGLDHTGNSIEGNVYFSALEKGDNFCLDRARVAAEIAGGKAIVIECLLRPENLIPDEDAGNDIMTSLNTGKIAHRGRIYPAGEEKSIIKSVKWLERGSNGYEIHENANNITAKPPKRVMEKFWKREKEIREQDGKNTAKKFVEKKMAEFNREYDSQISIGKFEKHLEKYQNRN